MNYLRSVLTTSQDEPHVKGGDGADTVDRLLDRYETATLTDDRRDVIRALKSLSKKHRVEVGSRGMPVLLDVLNNEKANVDVLNLSLDTLLYVVGGDIENEDGADSADFHELNERFAEIFVKDGRNVQCLLLLLADYDMFQIRWPTIKLLTILLRYQARKVQDVILTYPMAVSHIVDLLSDRREVIRNDAVLLLIELSKGNVNLQKILAYENAFERVLTILTEEGDDSVVFEDALYIILQLLKNNSSNQQLFKENSLIQRLAPLFQFDNNCDHDDDSHNHHHDHQDNDHEAEYVWSRQRVSSTLLLFQVLRTLVSPSNSPGIVSGCQKIVHQCGILKSLCAVAMSGACPADILAEGISTVADVLRGNATNQAFFAKVMAPSQPPRPATVVLLMAVINEKQPFTVRCAVVYCLQAYLWKNEDGKVDIVKTLLPSTVETTSVTCGHLLVSGLLSQDSVVVWFSACLLSHCLLDSPTQKEQLLKVQLATNIGSPPISLLQQCTNILMQTSKVQCRAAVLMLLATWLTDCSIAVAHFLQGPNHVPFLTSQASTSEVSELEGVVQGLCAFLLGICYLFNDDSVEKFNRKSLLQIVERRVGLETFLGAVRSVSENEAYVRSAQKIQLKAKTATDLVFDFEFTKLFKNLEGQLRQAFQSTGKPVANGLMSSAASQDSVLTQYKELIKQQDTNLAMLREQVVSLQSEKEKAVQEAAQLRHQLVTAPPPPIEQTLAEKLTLQSQASEAEIASLRQQVSYWAVLAQQREQESLWYRQHCDHMRDWFTQTAALQNPADADALGVVKNQVAELEAQLSYGWKAYEELVGQMDLLAQQKSESGQELQRALDENKTLREEVQKLKTNVAGNDLMAELAATNKEQDDLLLLLAEQDGKLSEYKRRLKALGVSVESEPETQDDEFSVNVA